MGYAQNRIFFSTFLQWHSSVVYVLQYSYVDKQLQSGHRSKQEMEHKDAFVPFSLRFIIEMR